MFRCHRSKNSGGHARNCGICYQAPTRLKIAFHSFDSCFVYPEGGVSGLLEYSNRYALVFAPDYGWNSAPQTSNVTNLAEFPRLKQRFAEPEARNPFAADSVDLNFVFSMSRACAGELPPSGLKQQQNILGEIFPPICLVLLLPRSWIGQESQQTLSRDWDCRLGVLKSRIEAHNQLGVVDPKQAVNGKFSLEANVRPCRIHCT